jgi:hypothetical protein
VPPAGPDAASASAGRTGALLTATALLVVMLSAAMSVDVVRAGYKIKGDEATYVGMALSAAYDRNLSFERRDLERFYGLYEQGPEGIFLKRGKQLRMRLRATPPFLFIFNNTAEDRTDRLFFGKAMAYSLAAAPFVWLLGMNGFLVFHVLLLFAVGVCGYLFLSAQSRPVPALAYVLGFLAVSVVPVYAVILTSDLFNFSVVFIAYFLWLYKEVKQPRFLLGGFLSDLAAAVLLGIVTYSKPWHAPLVAPLVLLFWCRRSWRAGFFVGSVAVLAAALMFAANAAISGEFNYQGGDRKTFYSAPDDPQAPRLPTAGFPFSSPDATWDARGQPMGRNEGNVDNVLAPAEIIRLFPNNVKYFLLGRHFGFIPYFFPGAVAILLWLLSRERFRVWRVLTFGGVALASLIVLVMVPYTWSGDGGPPGNRYFLSFYPALFFITPPLASSVPPLLAWIGGSLFTAKMLINPFYTAKYTWEVTERGWARRLPVELTMYQSLPVMLDTRIRGRVLYGQDPWMFLYFLDEHAWPPEPNGMWISGAGRADILIRTPSIVAKDGHEAALGPAHHFRVTANSPIVNTFTVSTDAGSQTVQLSPNMPLTFDIPVTAVRGVNGYAYLISARAAEGFVPRLFDPNAKDDRNLGVQMQLKALVEP